MTRRILFGGLALVLVTLALFGFVLPAIPDRCQDWYHRVDWVADRKVATRYGTDLSRLEKRLGRDRALEIHEETWNEAIEDVGAKPFYCN